ncbi:MAG: histidinol-phosphate transaminase [Gammaproteobacteria bacterium]|nr:histidinol-phosphate transaminase [Gammaproteobacteria bacterium]
MNRCDFDLLQLATPGVSSLKAYPPGKPLDELKREYGISEAIKLASNENPLGPSPAVIDAVMTAMRDVARYPDGNSYYLKKALADKHGVELNQIIIGNGSNDILELVTRAVVTPEHEVLFSEHSFAVYPIVTQAVGAKAVVAPAKNWGYDLDALAARISDKTRIIFIANPNNPTGTWLPKNQIKAFLDKVPSNVLVVLDEAYHEYVGEPEYGSALAWVSEYDNLLVARTFSKAYGMAGLRVGYSVSHPKVADLLNRVRQPFNVNSLGQVAAVAALHDKDYLARGVKLNNDGMAQLIAGFESLGLDYIPSVGNFICVDLAQTAAPINELLMREGVIVRPIANYGMPNHLRISIGLQTENARFLTALKKVLNK